MAAFKQAICFALFLVAAFAIPEEDVLSDEEEASPLADQEVAADPFIGQLGSYGGHCTTACSNHGHRYYWCYADTVKWDYCSPNNGDLTAYGRKCRASSKCGHGKGHRYTWCWTTTARWDYCVPQSGDIGDAKIPEDPALADDDIPLEDVEMS